MRLSSIFVVPLALAILSAASLSGEAAAQTPTNSTQLPSVTVDPPKQAARPRRPSRVVAVAPRPTSRTAQAPSATPATRTPPPAPGSTMAKLAALERTSSNCTDGCQSSFRHGNQPWNGCSTTGDLISPTCRNVRNFKTYQECRENGLFLAWKHYEVWWYCSSLLAGGKLAGEKRVQVAEVRRPGRRQ